MRKYKKSFMGKINKTKSCWIWLGGTNGKYGVYGLWKTPLKYAHRTMWEIHNKKKIPTGLEVCHRCDVPLCVNPKHLFVATHKENFLDAKIKGRMASGKRHGVYTKSNSWIRSEKGRWQSPNLLLK